MATYTLISPNLSFLDKTIGLCKAQCIAYEVCESVSLRRCRLTVEPGTDELQAEATAELLYAAMECDDCLAEDEFADEICDVYVLECGRKPDVM